MHGEPGGWIDARELVFLHWACLQLGSTQREWATGWSLPVCSRGVSDV